MSGKHKEPRFNLNPSSRYFGELIQAFIYDGDITIDSLSFSLLYQGTVTVTRELKEAKENNNPSSRFFGQGVNHWINGMSGDIEWPIN